MRPAHHEAKGRQQKSRQPPETKRHGVCFLRVSRFTIVHHMLPEMNMRGRAWMPLFGGHIMASADSIGWADQQEYFYMNAENYARYAKKTFEEEKATVERMGLRQ